jgi:CDP-paratose 2-epimerase
MKIILTGGLGCIGSLYATAAIARGDQVVIVDSGTDKRHALTREMLGGRVDVLTTRVERCDWRGILVACKPDAIVHMAAHTGIPHSAEDPEDDWASNVEATRVLLEALRKGAARIPTVVLSSVKPYRVPAVLPECGVDEDMPLEPDEPYAASKAAQSLLSMAYARSYDLPVTVLRCSNLYGPAPCHGPRHGWLTWACIAAAIGIGFEVQGDGTQSRDMLHAFDVAAAVDLSIARIEAMKGRAYNLGGGAENIVSVSEALALAGGAVRLGGPRRPRDDDHFFTDTRRIHAVTGWAPKFFVRAEISRMVAWASANRAALRAVYA